MAIKEFVCIRRHLHGDGTSTKVSIDVSDAKPGAVPDEIKNVSAGHSEYAVVEAKLTGSTIDIEFDNPPPEGNFEITAELLYSGAAKPKAHEKAESKEHATHHKAK